MNSNDPENRNHTDRNVERLLNRAGPGPRMPEPVRHRIRARLAELEPEKSFAAPGLPGRSRSLGGWWIRWAVGAAAVAVVVVAGLWLGDSRGSISWADVVDRLESVRTVRASTLTEATTEAGTRVVHRARIFFKDPGLSRTERFSSRPPATSDSPEVESIQIVKREPEKAVQMILYPGRQQAERVHHVFRVRGAGPPSRPTIDMVSESWRRLTRIASEDTRRIGERKIDGIPVVGFEASVRDLVGEPEAGMNEGRVTVWARRDTAAPVRIELRFRDRRRVAIRTEIADIEWDAPLDDDLFDPSIPEDWELQTTRREVVEYASASLAPHVTLRIGPEGGEPIVTERDVVAVNRCENISHPGTDIPASTRLTVELTETAAAGLRSFEARNPGVLLVAGFDDRILVVPDLKARDEARVGIDLTRLGMTIAELEEAYFTGHGPSAVGAGDEAGGRTTAAPGGQAIRFEARLAAPSPVEGWSGLPNPVTGEMVYLSPEVGLSNADIAEAWYDPSGGEHGVGLLLTEEGALKLAKITADHAGAYLALIVDGRVVSAPRIAAPITGGRALIRGNLTEEEARAVAAGIVPR